AASLPSAVAVAVDLSDAASVETIVQVADTTLGGADIVILTGGGPKPGTAMELTSRQYESAITHILSSPVEIVQANAARMTRPGWGRIIGVGSSGIQQPIPNLAASNVGRAALAGYLKTLAGELAPYGITVNMALPGRIATNRILELDQATAERTSSSLEEVRASSQSLIPMGRYGRPEDFAALVTFLAGQPAAYITGEQIRCDGGMVRSY